VVLLPGEELSLHGIATLFRVEEVIDAASDALNGAVTDAAPAG
jgi:hypothetical protein